MVTETVKIPDKLGNDEKLVHICLDEPPGNMTALCGYKCTMDADEAEDADCIVCVELDKWF